MPKKKTLQVHTRRHTEVACGRSPRSVHKPLGNPGSGQVETNGNTAFAAEMQACKLHSDQACRTRFAHCPRKYDNEPFGLFRLLRCPSDDLRLSAELERCAV